jgi:hypothetical protein
LLSALENMGENVSSFRKEKSPNPSKSYFKFQFNDFTLDFLPSTGSPLKFRDSLKKCDWLSVQQIDIPFISIDDLILIKESHGREKDMEDIEQLKRIKKEGEL